MFKKNELALAISLVLPLSTAVLAQTPADIAAAEAAQEKTDNFQETETTASIPFDKISLSL